MKWLLFLVALGTLSAVLLSTLLTALDPNAVDKNGAPQLRQTRSGRDWPGIDGSADKLFWFVQVSDIHISAFRDPERGPELMKLCEEYLPIIKPKVIVASGDLTDAKLVDGQVSEQVESEWVIYNKLVKHCRSVGKMPWLDVRGNHDSFDVVNFESPNNFYKKYSAHGSSFSKNSHFLSAYSHTLSLPFGNYSFILMDSCASPGPNRPFNFFGYLNDEQLSHLRSLEQTTRGHNHTVWVGHFPTSLIVQDPPVLRDIMSNAIAYLCGHLHTLGNMVPRMYSKHKTGTLELELGDWKDNRRFRVVAFDNDLLSFRDVSYGEWPLILVTNPKASHFLSPENEPVELIARSSHIRVLVFNKTAIDKVQVTIDGHSVGQASHEEGPLYTLPWDPQEYATGLHTLTVTTKDVRGKETLVEQSFSVDGTQESFKLLPRFILMLNIYNVAKILYAVTAIVFLLFLTSLRQCTNIRCFYFQGYCSFFNNLMMKVWLAARINASYYIITGSVLCLTFCPWFFGEILRNKIGAVFVWGVLVNGAFIPGGLTYIYGFLQLVLFNIPFVCLLGHQLDLRRKYGDRFTMWHGFTLVLPLLCFLIFNMYVGCTEFPINYGRYAFFLGPLRTGNVILIFVSVLLCQRTDLRQALAVNQEPQH